MKVWLAKDIDSADYELFYYKPVFDEGSGCFLRSKAKGTNSKPNMTLFIFCSELFEQVTGFKLKDGECKQIEIHIKPVKNKKSTK